MVVGGIAVLRNGVRWYTTLCYVVAAIGVGSPVLAQFSKVVNVPPDPDPGDAFFHSQVNVFDGGHISSSLFDQFQVNNSEVNFYGGSFEGYLNILSGSVNVFGGNLNGIVNVGIGDSNPAVLSLHGGTFDHVESFRGTTNIFGGEFRLGGVPIGGLSNVGSLAFSPGSLDLSGVLSDGTPFVFDESDGDSIDRGPVTLFRTALPAVGPGLIVASTDIVPLGIRQGQDLRADAGSHVPNNFNAGLGSHVRIEPGSQVGSNFEANGARVEILGGSVGDDFDAFEGSVVDASGGTIGNQFKALHRSTINLSGATIGDESHVSDASVLNLRAGRIGAYLDVYQSTLNMFGGFIGTGGGGPITIDFQSTANLFGGSHGGPFHALSLSTINLFGKEFALNGTPVNGLSAGHPLVISQRDVLLTGTLADGSALRLYLSTNSDSFAFSDYFSPDATVTIMLVPEPSCVVLFAIGQSGIAMWACGKMRRRAWRGKVKQLSLE
jgi:hypothetical protein